MGTTNSCTANPSGGTSQYKVGGILNLTQHTATPEQLAAGVVEPNDKGAVQQLLTFEELPTADEVEARAKALAKLASDHGCLRCMIGGAPFLMSTLERELHIRAITPLYAFSVRKSADQAMPDGSIRKVAIFSHQGFVEAKPVLLYGWESSED